MKTLESILLLCRNFFEIPLGMLQEKNVLAEFIAGAFRQKSPVPHYLIFRLKENPQIENLMENMIESCFMNI